MVTTRNENLEEFPTSYFSYAFTPVMPDGILGVDSKQIKVKHAFVFTFARAGRR